MSEPKGNTSYIREKNRATIPEDTLSHIEAKEGDRVSFYNVPGPAVIMIKTDSMNVSGFLKSLLAAVAVLAFFTVPTAFAHGQEQVIVTPNGTITQPVPTQVMLDNGSCYSTAFDSENRPIGNIMQIPVQSTAAFVPLRAEITYPKGDVSVFYFRTLPGSTANYQNNEIVNSGIASRVFLTDSVDNFNFVVGQQYSTPVNQMVRVTVYGNNTSPLPGIEIPICGLGFAFGFNFATSIPPHIPTPQELNGLNVDYFSQIIQAQNSIAQSQRSIDSRVSITSDVFQGIGGIMVIAIVVFTGGIFVLIHQYRKNKHDDFVLEEIKERNKDG